MTSVDSEKMLLYVVSPVEELEAYVAVVRFVFLVYVFVPEVEVPPISCVRTFWAHEFLITNFRIKPFSALAIHSGLQVGEQLEYLLQKWLPLPQGRWSIGDTMVLGHVHPDTSRPRTAVGAMQALEHFGTGVSSEIVLGDPGQESNSVANNAPEHFGVGIVACNC